MTKSTSSSESSAKSPKQGETDIETTGAGRKAGLSGQQYLLIAIAASHYALGIMGANYWQLVHPERIVLVAGVLAAVACGVAYVLARLGVAPTTAFFVVLVATLLFVRGGPVLWRVPTLLVWLGVAAVVGLASFLGQRLPEPALWISSVVLVGVIASGAAIDTYAAVRSRGESSVAASAEISLDLATTPDIYFVVLDAYPGLRALSAVFDEPKSDLKSDLEDLGFQVPASAWTSYGSTDLALPAILDMSYPMDPRGLTDASREDLFDMVSGANNTVAVLQANGYHTTMIESGWVGSSCGDMFDTCIASDWLDEVMFNLVWNSLGSEVAVGRYGHAFTVNALATMDALGESLDRPSSSPQFVFAHVIAPHPPYFLDESCSFSVGRARAEGSINPMQSDPALDEWFLAQTECVDSFVRDLGERTDEDDVVIVLADHGLRRHPIPSDGERPGDEAVLELMNVFLAVRTGDGCDIPDPILTSDLMREVFSCLSPEPLPPAPQRMFLSGGYEMSLAEIAELMELGS